MAQEPPSDTTQIRGEFEAAKNEVTTREEAGPIRPEGHPRENSPGWTDGPGLVENEQSANEWHKWVNEPYAKHNASIEAKQTTQPALDINEILDAAVQREEAAAQAKVKDERER